MVYSNKFVLCVLVNGNVVEELANGEVQIPFNTEYVLRFRNKNNRRAVVKFSIDGELVSGEGGYVIPANDYVDIKRHNNRDASFILVPLNSSEAVDAGKNGPNYDKQKGVVKAEFTLEKEPVRNVHHYYHKLVPDPTPNPFPNPWHQPWHNPPYYSTTDCMLNDQSSECIGGGKTMSCSMPSRNETRARTRVKNATATYGFSSPVQDGCTVEGNATGQSFRSVHVDLEDTSTVLQVFLRGYDVGKNFPKSYKQEPVRIPNVDLETENELLKVQLEEAKKKKALEKENERLRKELELYTN
jgi:hypothetical protein